MNASPVTVELSASADVAMYVNMAAYFAEMDQAERRDYLDAVEPAGYAAYDKPLWWVSRLAEMSEIEQPFGDVEARYHFDFDYRPSASYGWGPDKFEALLGAVEWLRTGNCDATGVTITDPLSTSLDHTVKIAVTVDVVDWLSALPVERRPEVMASSDYVDSEDFAARPYWFLVQEFSEGVRVDTHSGKHFNVDASSVDVYERVSARHGVTANGRGYWGEDDFDAACLDLPWLRALYFDESVEAFADPDHPEHAAYVAHLEDVSRLPGPNDIPLFDAA